MKNILLNLSIVCIWISIILNFISAFIWRKWKQKELKEINKMKKDSLLRTRELENLKERVNNDFPKGLYK